MKRGDRVRTLDKKMGTVKDILFSKASGLPFIAVVELDGGAIVERHFCNLKIIEE